MSATSNLNNNTSIKDSAFWIVFMFTDMPERSCETYTGVMVLFNIKIDQFQQNK